MLKTDDDREIVLEAPRTAAWALAIFFAGAAGALLLSGRRVAPVVLGVFALGALSRALRVHRLRLDLEAGAYVYRRGWLFAPPLRRGSLDGVAGVAIERHEPADGLVASKLRSRVVVLELDGWPEGEGHPGGGRTKHSFVLGFPMGPRVAQDKAADYARRLGTEVVDRAAE